ncbi:MAG: hypothetical protein QG670_2611 [Thermoproteota archaeon]|nr:hypothetical protein [Thermoproteota archaeon]
MSEVSTSSGEPSVGTVVKSSRTRVLIILIVLIAVLIISNAYVFMTFNDQVNKLAADKTSLQSQVKNLTDITTLNKTITLVDNQTVGQGAGSYTSWTFSAQYAGYVEVIVHTSTTTNTQVQVIYNSYSVVFDQTITVGAGGTAVFPVLPAQNIEVRIGNTNPTDTANERITATYYY